MATTSATTATPEKPEGQRRELRFWEAIAFNPPRPARELAAQPGGH
jgi:hypothetical protein